MSFSFKNLPLEVQKKIQENLPQGLDPEAIKECSTEFRYWESYDSQYPVNFQPVMYRHRNYKILETCWGILSQHVTTHPDGWVREIKYYVDLFPECREEVWRIKEAEKLASTR